jgi:glucose-6-phosphate dehydrogenase assembly protein OpcA
MSVAIASPATVPLWEVERELSRQLQARQDAAVPVVRARMSNLVIFCNQPAKADQVDWGISEVVAIHPARVLLLVEAPSDARGKPEVRGRKSTQTQTESESDLRATVNVWPVRIGGGRFVYSEQVTIRTGSHGIYRLPFAVRGLLIGDLPTNVWWETTMPPALAGPILTELTENAQQIVYDSLGWSDPARGMSGTASWIEQFESHDSPGHWRVASDLNWRRLKTWRRLVTQSLDPVSAPGAWESMQEVIIEHGPHAVIQAWELAGWLAQKLGWQVQSGKVQQGVEMAWRFRARTGESLVVHIRRRDHGPSAIRRVQFTCRINNQPARMELCVETEKRLAIHVEVRGISCEPRTITLPATSPAEIVARQLSDRARDHTFRQSMITAQTMARMLS